MKNRYWILLLFFTTALFAQKTKKTTMEKFEIPEAGIVFEAASGWEFFSKTGKLEQGKVQYSYGHSHVQGSGRLVNPSIIITIDKGSWFTDDKNYLEEKLGFHKIMGDVIKKTYPPGDKNNPLALKNAYYSEGVSEEADHPYGQHYILITFWSEKAGVHITIQTSEKDLKTNQEVYKTLLKSIRKM